MFSYAHLCSALLTRLDPYALLGVYAILVFRMPFFCCRCCARTNQLSRATRTVATVRKGCGFLYPVPCAVKRVCPVAIVAEFYFAFFFRCSSFWIFICKQICVQGSRASRTARLWLFDIFFARQLSTLLAQRAARSLPWVGLSVADRLPACLPLLFRPARPTVPAGCPFGVCPPMPQSVWLSSISIYCVRLLSTPRK